MSVLINFIIGFVAAFVGVIPPGLLNMSAAKISMKESRKAAVLFSIGVGVTVIFQTLVALLFAKYLDQHPKSLIFFKRLLLVSLFALQFTFFLLQRIRVVKFLRM